MAKYSLSGEFINPQVTCLELCILRDGRTFLCDAAAGGRAEMNRTKAKN